MVRLMKDCNQRYMIEVTRGRAWAHCIIRNNCEVRCKKYHLHRLTTNGGAAAGADHYDERWKPVPEAEYPLLHAVGKFLDLQTGWSTTERARSALLALKEQKPVSESDMEDDEVVATTPAASVADEMKTGKTDMSKKVKRSTGKSSKRSTISGLVKRLLREKRSPETILDLVKEKFPKCRTSLREIGVYRGQLIAGGELSSKKR